MLLLSARNLLRIANAAWRVAPSAVLDALLSRASQCLAALHGYGIESITSEVAAACAQLPRRPAVIFDGGAHQGEWSQRVLSSRAHRGDRFFLFEPSAVNIAKLRALGTPEFTIVPLAISDRSGRAPLYADAAGSGLGSLHQRDLGEYGPTHNQQEDVATTTLDEFARHNSIEHIDYLKLDVEGHELAALAGARRLLSDHRIDAVAFEFGGTQVDSRTFLRDYWNLFEGYGYKMHRVVPGGGLLPMAHYDVALEVFRLTTYVALVLTQ